MFAHIKQDNFDVRAMEYVFIGYSKGVKGYKLLKEPGGSKVNIRKDIIFDETCKCVKSEDLKMKNSRTLVDKSWFKVQVPTRETTNTHEVKSLTSSSSERKLTMAHNYHLTCYMLRR